MPSASITKQSSSQVILKVSCFQIPKIMIDPSLRPAVPWPQDTRVPPEAQTSISFLSEKTMSPHPRFSGTEGHGNLLHSGWVSCAGPDPGRTDPDWGSWASSASSPSGQRTPSPTPTAPTTTTVTLHAGLPSGGQICIKRPRTKSPLGTQTSLH